jgi:hypothetical protein
MLRLAFRQTNALTGLGQGPTCELPMQQGAAPDWQNENETIRRMNGR